MTVRVPIQAVRFAQGVELLDGFRETKLEIMLRMNCLFVLSYVSWTCLRCHHRFRDVRQDGQQWS